MSTPIGNKIRNIREALRIGRQEFADKTGIPKNSLIGIEVGKHEPGAKALIAIAKVWPEFSAYLLTDKINIKQKNPMWSSLDYETLGNPENIQVPIESISKEEVKNRVNEITKSLKTTPPNIRPVKEKAQTKTRKKLLGAVQEAAKKSTVKKSHGTK